MKITRDNKTTMEIKLQASGVLHYKPDTFEYAHTTILGN